jgi:hypothetical protein
MGTCDGRLDVSGERPAASALPRVLALTFVAMWVGTGLAAIVALPIAHELRAVFGLRLAPAPPGSAAIAVRIATNNLRVAATPFLFAVLRIRAAGFVSRLGDVVVGVGIGANVAFGGLVLGAYGLHIATYLPQWPFEWAGLAVAGTAWLRMRGGRGDRSEVAGLALGCGLLLCLGALVETYAVPQT